VPFMDIPLHIGPRARSRGAAAGGVTPGSAIAATAERGTGAGIDGRRLKWMGLPGRTIDESGFLGNRSVRAQPGYQK
jgi:hypothetical protein